MTLRNLSDEALITMYQENQDAQAFGELYNRYNQKVMLYCTKILGDRNNALDVTQDLFIKVSEKLGQLKEKVTFVKWLFTIAYNDCMNFVKKQKRFATTSTEILNNRENDVIDLEEKEMEEVKLSKMETAMQFLATDERTMLEDKYFGNASISDLETKYGMGASAVKMRLARSRNKVKRLMM